MTTRQRTAPTHPVVEIFGPTIQGEGVFAGKRSHFIRFGGCSYRCAWCDSMHAVDPKLVRKNSTHMTAREIHDKINSFGKADIVTLTGGDPVMHKLDDVAIALRGQYQIAVETQGALYKRWLAYADHVCLSPKAPSSGEAHRYSSTKMWEIVEKLTEESVNISTKIVVDATTDESLKRDMDFALNVFIEIDDARCHADRKQLPHIENNRYDPTNHKFLSVMTPVPSSDATDTNTKLDILRRWRRTVEHSFGYDYFAYDVSILPQMHVLVWGTEHGH